MPFAAAGGEVMITPESLISEAQMLRLCMRTDPKEGKQVDAVQREIIEIVKAWHRGKLLPKWEVPKLQELCKEFDTPDAIL
jgi:hypothetical protein